MKWVFSVFRIFPIMQLSVESFLSLWRYDLEFIGRRNSVDSSITVDDIIPFFLFLFFRFFFIEFFRCIHKFGGKKCTLHFAKCCEDRKLSFLFPRSNQLQPPKCPYKYHMICRSTAKLSCRVFHLNYELANYAI